MPTLYGPMAASETRPSESSSLKSQPDSYSQLPATVQSQPMPEPITTRTKSNCKVGHEVSIGKTDAGGDLEVGRWYTMVKEMIVE
ncbi:hypothetical protein Tco_0349711 [Tanacetum coccineum]